MESERPQVERTDLLLWLAIALLVPVVYLLASSTWEMNDDASKSAGANAGIAEPVTE
ncbi:MAG TPA: hypothetical protein QGG59_08940 [Planctomycetota bacterium]|jgi:hypothetical protein|nr:hypothetical protein [Planctomycetota bacterium]MDP7246942.1 hypothetical protein [Planctomycetota bacterium]HJM40227.1 hypothetical protein [Planctomycetota bacterium]|tara:strand:- start:17742 stop:17912 length:171 start_codon:yes stop_codon:yes gene_type:complete